MVPLLGLGLVVAMISLLFALPAILRSKSASQAPRCPLCHADLALDAETATGTLTCPRSHG